MRIRGYRGRRNQPYRTTGARREKCGKGERVMAGIIFHIDVNSAYLSWTAVDRLAKGDTVDLRLIPSIIGGDAATRHGVVLAKSLPAKAYGVQTGEPVAQAVKKCPELLLVSPDHKLYRRRSRELMALLKEYTPDIEQVSVDECYMDFTPIAHRFSSPAAAAAEIRAHVREKLGFTVNIGISSVKVLAKMASDFEKPDKTHTLFPDELEEKLWPLPVRELFSVGGSTAARLATLGIRTIGDLAACPPRLLESHFKSHGRQIWEYAHGIDGSAVVTEHEEAKSIGNSTTLREDVATEAEADRILLELAESVSARLRKNRLLAGCVTVEIKYSTFVRVTRQTAAYSPTDSTGALHETACRLFRELWNGEPLRLLGLRATRLVGTDAPVQLSLFDVDWQALRKKEAAPLETRAPRKPDAQKQRKLEQALDAIKSRYGKDAVVRGSRLEKPDV